MQYADLTPAHPVEHICTVEDLAQELITSGLLTVEEWERILGLDLDGDCEWWEEDGHAAAAGLNVQLRDGIRIVEDVQSAQRDAADRAYFDEHGKWPEERPRSLLPTGPTMYQALSRGAADCVAEDLHKAVSSTAPKYKGKHPSKSGRSTVYEYDTSTSSGKVGRADNKQHIKTTGNKAGQASDKSKSTTGKFITVKAGDKKRNVKVGSKGDAAKLHALHKAGKVSTK